MGLMPGEGRGLPGEGRSLSKRADAPKGIYTYNMSLDCAGPLICGFFFFFFFSSRYYSAAYTRCRTSNTGKLCIWRAS